MHDSVTVQVRKSALCLRTTSGTTACGMSVFVSVPVYTLKLLGRRRGAMPLVALRARALLARSTSRGMSSLANERAIEAARRHLPNSTGRLLEVGSGTGSNLTSLALAFRGWHIQPSDIDALLLPKIAAAAEQWSNVAAPVCIDAAAPADDWPVEPSFDAILAVNVCHYASPQATRGLVRPPPSLQRTAHSRQLEGRALTASNHASLAAVFGCR